jgi:hypothetical protein
MNDKLQLLPPLIEALKLNKSTTWIVPCLNEDDSFEIEIVLLDGQYFWRTRNLNADEWIEVSTLEVLNVLTRNDVKIDIF